MYYVIKFFVQENQHTTNMS